MILSKTTRRNFGCSVSLPSRSCKCFFQSNRLLKPQAQKTQRWTVITKCGSVFGNYIKFHKCVLNSQKDIFVNTTNLVFHWHFLSFFVLFHVFRNTNFAANQCVRCQNDVMICNPEMTDPTPLVSPDEALIHLHKFSSMIGLQNCFNIQTKRTALPTISSCNRILDPGERNQSFFLFKVRMRRTPCVFHAKFYFSHLA